MPDIIVTQADIDSEEKLQALIDELNKGGVTSIDFSPCAKITSDKWQQLIGSLLFNKETLHRFDEPKGGIDSESAQILAPIMGDIDNAIAIARSSAVSFARIIGSGLAGDKSRLSFEGRPSDMGVDGGGAGLNSALPRFRSSTVASPTPAEHKSNDALEPLLDPIRSDASRSLDLSQHGTDDGFWDSFVNKTCPRLPVVAVSFAMGDVKEDESRSSIPVLRSQIETLILPKKNLDRHELESLARFFQDNTTLKHLKIKLLLPADITDKELTGFLSSLTTCTGLTELEISYEIVADKSKSKDGGLKDGGLKDKTIAFNRIFLENLRNIQSLQQLTLVSFKIYEPSAMALVGFTKEEGLNLKTLNLNMPMLMVEQQGSQILLRSSENFLLNGAIARMVNGATFYVEYNSFRSTPVLEEALTKNKATHGSKQTPFVFGHSQRPTDNDEKTHANKGESYAVRVSLRTKLKSGVKELATMVGDKNKPTIEAVIAKAITFIHDAYDYQNAKSAASRARLQIRSIITAALEILLTLYYGRVLNQNQNDVQTLSNLIFAIEQIKAIPECNKGKRVTIALGHVLASLKKYQDDSKLAVDITPSEEVRVTVEKLIKEKIDPLQIQKEGLAPSQSSHSRNTPSSSSVSRFFSGLSTSHHTRSYSAPSALTTTKEATIISPASSSASSLQPK